MKHRTGDDWFPFWVDKWIFGSTRHELSPDEQSVWVDLLSLSAKDSGFIRANESMAYPISQLAGLLCKSEELISRTIEKCVKYNKITILDNNILYITNYNNYELSKRQKIRIEENRIEENRIEENRIKASQKSDTMSLKSDTMSLKSDTMSKKSDIMSKKRTFAVASDIHSYLFLDNKDWLQSLKDKFPGRDYEYQFSKMINWWQEKRKRLPENPKTAFSNWIENAKPEAGKLITPLEQAIQNAKNAEKGRL